MPVSKTVLGMNARNFLYIRPFNQRKYKLIADDKLATKKLLLKHKVPTPDLIKSFESLQDVRDYDWSTAPRSFVIKPAHGYGGRGIRVVTKWDGTQGVSQDTIVRISDLESEIFGILDGEHSLKNLPDIAFIEERIKLSTFFKKYTYKGVPDIRVIVCNGIPVMAMMRLPTVASHGKANLHLGALGVGIDMRTGITTYGVAGSHRVANIPGKKIKVQGIKTPGWNEVLLTATRAQMVSKLGFVGIDIVLDHIKGPQVLEINARPGLSIQIANQDSLRTRLERIDHIKITEAQDGVVLAQKLFADSSLQQVEDSDNTLGLIEKVVIYGNEKKKTVRAKVDTGAFRTSIDVDLVHELGLDKHHELVKVRSGSGRQHRKTAKVSMKMKGKSFDTIVSYTDRSHLNYPVIIGRKDLKGFTVDPNKIPDGTTIK